MGPVSAIKGITEMIPTVWNNVTEIRKAIINHNGFIASLDFEIRLNLDLLDSLNTNLDKLNIKSSAFAELVNSFETNVSLAVISEGDRSNYHDLEKLLKRQFERKETFDNEDGNSPDPVQNVLEALNFSVRKIETLRRIARLAAATENETEVLKNINVNTRLKNIKTALLVVQKSLDT